MNVDPKWIDVVTNPLGLAGFALFLVFLIVSRFAPKGELRWLAPAFVTLALIALLGGIGLTWRDSKPTPQPQPVVTPQPGKKNSGPEKPSISVGKIETGPGSAVGVGQNVNISIGAPAGKNGDPPKPKPATPEK